jgi:hypothetical protein
VLDDPYAGVAGAGCPDRVLAGRVERDAALNDVHLLLPHFDQTAVGAVIEDLKNVEDVPPSETGSSRELVTLKRRQGLDDVSRDWHRQAAFRAAGRRRAALWARVRAIHPDPIVGDARAVIGRGGRGAVWLRGCPALSGSATWFGSVT